LRGASAGRPFLKPFFRIRETFFQSFHTKFSSSFYVISLAWKISYCLSANHNLELRCVICTGVTLFALMLHFLHWCYTWTALLSANQNRVIFSCILLGNSKAFVTITNMLILAVYSWHVSYTNLLNVLAHQEFLCNSVVKAPAYKRLWFRMRSVPDVFHLSLTPDIQLLHALWLVNLASRILPYGPLKFKAVFVVKIFRD